MLSITSLLLLGFARRYGSRAKFVVMCPHTSFWQATISDVVAQLVACRNCSGDNDADGRAGSEAYGVDGVYIDQIAAAGPRPCWDRSHGHSVGGGSHWVSGYQQLLTEVLPAGRLPPAPLV